MKINWVCADCGMYSSRRYNVGRHIETSHSGVGSIVSFIEYLAGVKIGQYVPKSGFGYRPTQQQMSCSKAFAEEYYRELARKSVVNAPKNLNRLCINNVLNSTEWSV